MAWVTVASADQVKEGEVLGVEAEGTPIALYRLEGALYATHNICTHAEALLSDGYVVDDCVECPLHQAIFEIRTGQVVDGPAEEDLRTFPVRIDGDQVMVEV